MKKRILLLSLIASCITVYGEEILDSNIRLNETVVTATGFTDSQANQIKNMTVITKKDIEDKGYNNVEDVLRNAPGINFSYNGFGMVADLRGQGSQGTDANGSQGAAKRVQVLIDGVPVNVLDVSHALIPMNSIPVDSIEKIEIINGGGSVLYGSGTAGGVINILTNKTQKEAVSGKVYYQNSSFATNKVGFTTGIKASDNILIDLGYENINGNGYRSKDDNKSGNFRGGLTYNINENQTLKLKASKFKQDYFETGALTKEQIKVNRKQANLDNTIDGKVDREEVSLTYDLKVADNLRLNLTGYYQETERKYLQTINDNMAAMGRAIPYTTVQSGTMEDKKLGLKLKTDYEYSSGNITFGYDYLKNKAERDITRDISYTIPAGFGPMSGIKMSHIIPTTIDLKKESHSLFALNRHSLTEKLESTIGYRYEYSRFNINRQSISSSKTNIIDSDKSENNHAFELGLNYKYSPTGNIYTKYERGFRSPSPTELVDNPSRTSGYVLNNVGSEKYDTYEIGMKDVIGNSFVSATAFFTKTKDEIFTDMANYSPSSGNPTWTVKNIPETERKGIELFAEQYFDKFRVNESLTYVDAKIKKGEGKGDKIAYVPKVKATVGASYNVNPNVMLISDVNYYSKMRDTEQNKLSSHITFDVGATYKHESGIGLQAGIKNLFGKKYYTYESKAYNEYIPAAERTYYVGISYDF